MGLRTRSILWALALGMATIAFAQSDRGTVTGTVADPAGAVVPTAEVVLRNVDTGAQFPTVTTATGNFTLAQIPVGSYELSISAVGFSKYVQTGLKVQVALTIRVDAPLKVGATTESITVAAAAPLLRTENAEASVNVSGDATPGSSPLSTARRRVRSSCLSPYLPGGAFGAIMVRDSAKDAAAVDLERSTVKKEETLQIQLREGGGFIARLSK